jgi:predicted nucleic acid-binding protein
MISGYMLDTNIFNCLMDSKLAIEEVAPADSEIYATHIQIDELSQTPNDKGRRDQLLQFFQIVDPVKISTSVIVWDISKWNEAEWADDAAAAMYNGILNLLPEKKKNPLNPCRDAIIAVTAIKKNLVLITADQDLSDALKQLGHEKNVQFLKRKAQ